MKTRTTIYINEELLKRARQYELNLSAFCEMKLNETLYKLDCAGTERGQGRRRGGRRRGEEMRDKKEVAQ